MTRILWPLLVATAALAAFSDRPGAEGARAWQDHSLDQLADQKPAKHSRKLKDILGSQLITALNGAFTTPATMSSPTPIPTPTPTPTSGTTPGSTTLYKSSTPDTTDSSTPDTSGASGFFAEPLSTGPPASSSMPAANQIRSSGPPPLLAPMPPPPPPADTFEILGG